MKNKAARVVKKSDITRFLIFVLLCVLIWGGYYIVVGKIELRYDIQEDVFQNVFQISDVEETEEAYIIHGWAFELEKDSMESMKKILLVEENKDTVIVTNTEQIPNEEVNEYFICEYDYLNSGFIASISKDRLDEDKKYEICISYHKSPRIAYRTGVWLQQGNLVDENDTYKLNVTGTVLEDVVKKGNLRVSRPDIGAYVYQYQGKLYWIMEKNYPYFDLNDEQYVQYQLNTTQVKKLPQERLDNKWYWSNIGFWFKEKELLEGNTGEYRVAVVELPTEYSITEIWTGYYNTEIKEWEWEEHFRPFYEFE